MLQPVAAVIAFLLAVVMAVAVVLLHAGVVSAYSAELKPKFLNL